MKFFQTIKRDSPILHQEVTGVVIQAFYKIYNSLGYGFLEKVYENSLVIELNKTILAVQQQFPIKVFYSGKEVGEYFADLLVENKVIVELKSVTNKIPQHEANLSIT